MIELIDIGSRNTPQDDDPVFGRLSGEAERSLARHYFRRSRCRCVYWLKQRAHL